MYRGGFVQDVKVPEMRQYVLTNNINNDGNLVTVIPNEVII